LLTEPQNTWDLFFLEGSIVFPEEWWYGLGSTALVIFLPAIFLYFVLRLTVWIFLAIKRRRLSH